MNIFQWRQQGQKHFNLFFSGGRKKWNNWERQKNMEKENKTDGSDLVKMRCQIQILWNLLNLNESQTSEILIVVAVIMRKKVQKQSPGDVLQKKVFLEISPENSQENTYAGVFFLEPFIKKESLTLVFFCEFYEHLSKNTIFYRTPQVAASVKAYNFTKIRLRYGCFFVNFLKISGTFFWWAARIF